MNLDELVEKNGMSLLMLFVILLALCFDGLMMNLQTPYILAFVYMAILSGVPHIWRATKDGMLSKQEQAVWLLGSAVICIFVLILLVCRALPFSEIMLRSSSLVLTLLVSMEYYQLQCEGTAGFSKWIGALYQLLNMFCILKFFSVMDLFFDSTAFLMLYAVGCFVIWCVIYTQGKIRV